MEFKGHSSKFENHIGCKGHISICRAFLIEWGIRRISGRFRNLCKSRNLCIRLLISIRNFGGTCRYIDRPLLVGGRKFHVRAYVLCVGSISVYVASDGLALFAAEPYQAIGSAAPNLDAHLTNTCRLNGSVPEEDVVMLLSELPQVGPRSSWFPMGDRLWGSAGVLGTCSRALPDRLYRSPNRQPLYHEV
jgi:Tubulin-tyrosine ligase family